MPENDAFEDVERLENRMRTNFFEVEKRLTNLEGSSTATAMDEIKERLQELEDLQMLIQAEFLQIKQQIGVDVTALGESDISKRVEKIEEVVSKGVPVAVQKDLETRFEKLEKISNASEIKKMLDSFETRIRELQARPVQVSSQGTVDMSPIIRRIESLEKKPVQISSSQGTVDLSPLIRRIENLEKRPAQASVDSAPIARRIEEMEKNYSQRLDRVQKMIEERMDLNALMKRLEFNENMIKDTRAYYSKKISEMEESIESSGKLLTEEGMKGFLNKLYETRNEISKKVEQFETAKERLDKLIRERQDLISKLEESEVNVSKSEALLIKIRTEAAKIQSMEEKLNSMEERIGVVIKDRIGEMEYIRNELFEKVRKLNERVSADLEKSSSLRDEMSSLMKNEKEKSEYTKQEMLSRSDEIRKSIEKLDKKYRDSDIESRIQMGVSELRIKFEKIADEIERAVNQKIREFEKMRFESEKTLNSISEIEKRVSSKLESSARHDVPNYNERIESLKRSFMEENQKQWNEIKRIAETARTMPKTAPVQAIDEGMKKFYSDEMQKQWDEIRKMGEAIKGMESKIGDIAIAHAGNSDPKVIEDIRKLWEETRKLSEAEKSLEKIEMEHKTHDQASIANLSKSYMEEAEKQWSEIRRLDNIVMKLGTSHDISERDEREYENAARAFNDSLRKFTSLLDSKLETMQKNIQSKLYSQLSEDVSRKIIPQRQMNLEPVISQISSLEREIMEMQRYLRNQQMVVRRVPAIIE